LPFHQTSYQLLNVRSSIDDFSSRGADEFEAPPARRLRGPLAVLETSKPLYRND
jgi:hypothetical protein